MDSSILRWDYKEVPVKGEAVGQMLDSYEAFGWELDDRFSAGLDEAVAEGKPVVLHFRRSRSIVNKAELTRLQRNFEACLDEIAALEKSKTAKPLAYALILGILGTACMAGSVFAVTATPPKIGLCIALAIPGFLGWIFPLSVYRRTLARENKRIAPLIAQKQAEIDALLEKGNHLLH